ncbi:MAG TPA: diacylglycerol kinase family protein [Cytophagales bacterium]|nr:diacylglycerol kinase family protein [Cytophagales bacterium]
MEKEKVLFIINPISGAKNKIRIPDLIKKHLDLKQFDFEISFTEAAKHAEKLTLDGIKSGFNKFIAVGGDGTINEIAGVLVNTSNHLGIIPSGSGNGLSRHLGIPLNPVEAIKNINKNKVLKIDSCSLNGRPFFCTAGVGFDAHVGKLFADSKVRGLNTYVKTTLSEFRKYNPDTYKITINDKVYLKEAFLITFANSAQYGNNAYIAPHADIQDGLLDVCIVKPFPKYKIVPIGIRLFKGTIDKSMYLEIIRAPEVKVERTSEGPLHVDGEPCHMGKELLIKLYTQSLGVLVP